MGAGPAPGEYDEAELLAAIRRILSEGRAGAATEDRPGQAVYRAYVNANLNDSRHGNLAGLVLFWVTGGDNAPERLDLADEILNGTGEDPRRDKVFDVVRRLATGEITWEEFAKVTKKGLIPKERPEVPVASAEAIPLAGARDELAARLSGDTAVGLEEAWRVFVECARQPVAAAPPLYVENDMCLFQWGAYDWGEGQHFECDFTRQFVLHDTDGDYDHMEQLSLALLFDADDSDLAKLGSGDLWSGDDLEKWVQEVEKLDAFRIGSTKAPRGHRVQQSEV